MVASSTSFVGRLKSALAGTDDAAKVASAWASGVVLHRCKAELARNRVKPRFPALIGG